MAAQARNVKLAVSPTVVQYHKPIYAPKTFYKRHFYPSDEAKATLEAPWLRRTDPLMPPYPYGKNVTFPEANDGLYGGTTIQSGNKISDGRNKGRTLRKWYPNIRVERIRSEALNRDMAIPIASRVMRTIKKCGGLDQYVLGDKPARIKELGLLGWKLRWLVRNSPMMKEKIAEERKELGLPDTSPSTETFENAWADPEQRAILLKKLDMTWEELREKDARFQRHVKDTLRWKDHIPEMKTLQTYTPSTISS